jgi:preprotein translocase subunit SecG
MHGMFDRTFSTTSLILLGVIVIIMLLALVLLQVARSLSLGPDGVTMTGKYGSTKWHGM